MNVVAVIQARVASTRLYGKVLMDIRGKPMLQHVVERASRIQGVSKVVVATTFHEENRQIVNWCDYQGITRMQGGRVMADGNDDVLARYLDVATFYNADVIVRITGDCPLLCPEVGSAVLARLLEEECDYSSNVFPTVTFPDGCDVEAFPMRTLLALNEKAQLSSEREHPTSYIWSHPNEFRIRNFTESADMSHLRLCVDSEQDLAFVRAIYDKMARDDFTVREVYALLQAEPELMALQSTETRNEGLRVSQARDKKKKRQG